MKSIKALIKAIKENKTLVWNDPDPIKDTDYTISWIEELTEDFEKDTPILIHYGGSEAQVFCHEILIKK